MLMEVSSSSSILLSPSLGVLAAAINATTLALINAGIPIYDYVIATNVGYLAKQPLLDLNRMEEGGGATNPSLTMASYGRRPDQVLLLTADGRIAGDKLVCMTDLAKLGITKLFQLLDSTIVKPTLEEQTRNRDSSINELLAA